jgi:hypothetical protein
MIFLRFGNTARQDASAHENVTLFLREPLDACGVAKLFFLLALHGAQGMHGAT